MSEDFEESVNDFEYSCSKTRGKTSKLMCRLPKKHAGGFIQKSVIEDNRRRVVGEELPLPKDLTGLSSQTVHYSLNKHARWKIAASLRDEISEFQDSVNRVRVSALENEYLGNVEWSNNTIRNRSGRGRAIGYHDVEVDFDDSEESDEEIHRLPRARFAHALTLTEKEKPSKKKSQRRPNLPQAKRNRNRGGNGVPFEHIVEESNPEGSNRPDVHLRYEISIPLTAPAVVHRYSQNLVKHDSACGYRFGHARNGLRHGSLWHEDGVSEMDESDYFSEEDEPVEDWETEYFRVSPPTACLDDFLVADSRSGNKWNSRKKHIVSSGSESSVDSGSFDIVDKPLLRQVSKDESFIPRKFRTSPNLTETNQAGTSSILRESFQGSNVPPSYFKSLPISVEIEEGYLFPEILKKTFGTKYYEASCIPRRFCVDISESVRNVMTVSHGEKSVSCNVSVLVVFQIPLPTLSHFKVLDANVTPWENVQVWINGLFSRDVGHVSLAGALDDDLFTQKPEEILKAAALRIGTLPIKNFENLSNDLPVSKVKRHYSLSKGVMEDYLHPKAECFRQEEAAQVALEESNFARKLQRQLTAVEQYAWFTENGDTFCGVCYNHPVRDIGFCMAECKHWFCTECWTQYSTEQIRSGRAPIKCPDQGCDNVLDYDTLSTVLALPLCRNYAFLLRDQHLQLNSNRWVWCRNSRCGRVVRIEDDARSDILTCICGELWCLRCSNSIHWPASCDHAELYLRKVKSNGDDVCRRDLGTEKVVAVKRCPHCSMPMQKDFGCNHIVCRCQREFCWCCLSTWDGGRHYNCKPSKNHETVALRDVAKGSDNLMDRDLYLRSVGHRQAAFPEKVTALRKAINACLKSHKNLKLLPDAKNRLANIAPEDVEELLTAQILLASEFSRSFLRLHQQVHYFLEHTYVWLYFSSSKRLDEYRGLMQAADRLNFVIYRSEEACMAGNLQKVVNLMPSAEKLLKQIVLHIMMVKKSKNAGK